VVTGRASTAGDVCRGWRLAPLVPLVRAGGPVDPVRSVPSTMESALAHAYAVHL
jgi:hypothetical protein